MAYDENLAQRVRAVVANRSDVVEKKLFGNLQFSVGGNMACSVSNNELNVRTGADRYEEALARPNVREFARTGKPMRGMVTVDAAGLQSDAALAEWVNLGLTVAATLPPK
ncbi:MAG: TfoX/Sxy family protein [Anaerolineae bacterium]|nr:TfoX/Sxy family protein [Anaerolineae bacterium]